jgi:hypothetical protein
MKVKRTTPASPRRPRAKKAAALVAAAKVQQTTLYELVETVSEYARNDAEVLATIVHLVNSGQVRLIGRLRNARIALPAAGRLVA